MSCYIAPLTGGSPEIFPIQYGLMEKLRNNGRDAARTLGLKDMEIDGKEYIGAVKKPDETPFYLWAAAPDLATGESKPWNGAFFAPFGVGNIHGKVMATPGDKLKDEFAITVVEVHAELKVRGSIVVAASWALEGSQLTVPNKAVLINKVNIIDAGPHDRNDIRRCIALHAPLRTLGEPRAIVSMQCGVAAACLIEAIC